MVGAATCTPNPILARPLLPSTRAATLPLKSRSTRSLVQPRTQFSARQFPTLFRDNHRVGRTADELGSFIADHGRIKYESRHSRSKYAHKRIEREIDGRRIVRLVRRVRLD